MVYTKKDYFTRDCSDIVKKKWLAANILNIINLVILGVMAVWAIIALSALAYVLEQSTIFQGAGTDTVGALIVIILIPAICTFVFTLMGMKKNSTGLYVWATIFGFFSSLLLTGLLIGNTPLRWLIVFGTLAMYIITAVFTSQNNREYKNYLVTRSAA